MKRNISLWQLMGFAVTSLVGTVLHFLYDWLGKPIWIAPFSGVNESTWEHMKLFFWPAFVFALFQSFFFRERGNFWCVKLRGIVLGLVFIPIAFYTYNGVIGKSSDWFNITVFFIAAAVSYISESKLFSKESLGCKNPKLALFCLFFIAVLFVAFTFYTPKIEIFKDPITASYGLYS